MNGSIGSGLRSLDLEAIIALDPVQRETKTKITSFQTHHQNPMVMNMEILDFIYGLHLYIPGAS